MILQLCLDGLTTGYGYGDRGVYRLSKRVPQRSHVIGLLMCACGYARGEWPGWVSDLTIEVEPTQYVDSSPRFDYQTIRGGITYDGKPNRDAIGHRQFWGANPCYVTVSGNDDVIQAIRDAVKKPRWQLYLGRRSCVPSLPVWMPET